MKKILANINFAHISSITDQYIYVLGIRKFYPVFTFGKLKILKTKSHCNVRLLQNWSKYQLTTLACSIYKHKDDKNAVGCEN